MKSRTPGDLSRRTFLQGMGAVAVATAVGCGHDTTGASKDAGASADGGAGSDGGSNRDSAVAPNQCTDNSVTSAEALLAPIDTFVILCMENRSFDHYLGARRLLEASTVDGLTGTESNLAPNGSKVEVFKLDDFTPADPPHGWDASHAQWNMGKNDGFVTEHAGADQSDVMGYHLRSQLPMTYALADGAAICDRYFASVMGPTWPNRFYLHGATSKGNKGNTPLTGFTSLWDRLDDAKLTGTNYYHDVPWCSGAYFRFSGLAGISKYFTDAEAGTLPNVSIIDPQFFGAGANDDHPDHDVQLGQALIASVFTALAKSKQWERSMFILTYDEHGGFYDHVPPPTIDDERPEFTQLGFRVPTLVAGPYSRRGCPVSTVYDHASILKTLAVRWKLPSLNQRMTAANDLSATLSPLFLGKPQPPPELPTMSMSRSRLESLRPGATPSHEEIRRALDDRIIPRHLDRRAPGLGATAEVLRWGERLGALHLTR